MPWWPGQRGTPFRFVPTTPSGVCGIRGRKRIPESHASPRHLTSYPSGCTTPLLVEARTKTASSVTVEFGKRSKHGKKKTEELIEKMTTARLDLYYTISNRRQIFFNLTTIDARVGLFHLKIKIVSPTSRSKGYLTSTYAEANQEVHFVTTWSAVGMTQPKA